MTKQLICQSIDTTHGAKVGEESPPGCLLALSQRLRILGFILIIKRSTKKILCYLKDIKFNLLYISLFICYGLQLDAITNFSSSIFCLTTMLANICKFQSTSLSIYNVKNTLLDLNIRNINVA